ncbi:HBL158Wp [Eremothecium sinecaudum]|uniref:HBL158Wp n=1 Tax=Eremothecium sinecaudum TaxID=45286 RepID=A0A109UWD9_9SACH|nr:HBL158Wp [Eremothecium sinecaudum]AMD18744.1 HBL158Wp [Eremothecium sinecaudum]
MPLLQQNPPIQPPPYSRASQKLKSLLSSYGDNSNATTATKEMNGPVPINLMEKSLVHPPRTIYTKANFSIPGHYEVLQMLGKGSYGTVVSAVDNFNPNYPIRIAIKKITNIFQREVLLKRAIRELKFMHYFKGHKNIVSLINLEIVNEKPYDGLYCYQELIDYDLARVIHSNVQFSEFHIKHFTYQILCGVKYIHSADVIHRDLKPGNILCSISGQLKICDFGLARGISPLFTNTKTSNHITNYVATRWYRAPELILSHKRYNKSIDMWAIGCILAEFYGRKPIFMGQDSMHQISEIVKVLGTPSRDTIIKYGSSRAYDIFCPPKPQYVKIPWVEIYPFASADALDLVEHLLDWDPDKRLIVEEAIEHEFVSSVRDKSDEPMCPHGPFNFSYEAEFKSMSNLREVLYAEVKQFQEECAAKDIVPSLPIPQQIYPI